MASTLLAFLLSHLVALACAAGVECPTDDCTLLVVLKIDGLYDGLATASDLYANCSISTAAPASSSCGGGISYCSMSYGENDTHNCCAAYAALNACGDYVKSVEFEPEVSLDDGLVDPNLDENTAEAECPTDDCALTFKINGAYDGLAIALDSFYDGFFYDLYANCSVSMDGLASSHCALNESTCQVIYGESENDAEKCCVAYAALNACDHVESVEFKPEMSIDDGLVAPNDTTSAVSGCGRGATSLAWYQALLFALLITGGVIAPPF